ncbi:DUF418 domain-containing protein [Tsukamurella tyrosinosolvens]|uniref:DUF418 domain-containing protein n=1 Tax=Tsukamurella tyrosinosolvens TaxID=57704 RepID=UPI002DD435DE|nr:DUF418 domain-containing protein [Tsukamurella tyrosinosolvens]MEC4615558.1 DUF418 domain-containing protein [Tsukamurella tyrosinosolvens]
MNAEPSPAQPPAHTVAAPASVRAKRSIAPDFARGLMLALIAIANVPYFILHRPHGVAAHAADGSWADRVAQTLAIVGIDSRVYPMFAFLFGYGIVQMYTRQLASGTDPKDARRVLRRRHWWMIAFGFVHAALLWFGDIIGAYGIAGLLLVWLFLDRPDRTLKIWIGIFLTIPTLLTVGSLTAGVLGYSAPPSTGTGAAAGPERINETTGYLDAVLARIEGWGVYILPASLLGFIILPAILLGMLAARHKILDQPSNHIPLLRRVARIGITVGVVTAVPLALLNLDALGINRSDNWILLPLHTLGGLFGGLGYVAIFGLIAAHLERHRDKQRAGTFPWAVQALGKRSMSGYMFQSVAFSPILAAWGLGLGDHLSSWSAALYAIAAWGLSVFLATRLERAGRRGPAEWLLRKLAYPRPAPARGEA